LLASAALALAACTRPRPRPQLKLTTTAEQTRFVETGRYDEVVALCRDFARVHSGVRCDVIGRTVQDRPIVALAVTRASRADAPAILLQGGIHAGEIEGKDAGFWFVRDLLDGKVAAGALDTVNIVFVPVINPDGHERFGPNHRPNQRGPAEMGFRTNGARQNLNRDHTKADTPEIQAVLRVFREWNPLIYVDMHATDGAKFEHDISVIVAPVAPRTDGLHATADALSQRLLARLTELGHLPLAFYPSFDVHDDPRSGFSHGEAPPRFSQAYAGVRSRLGILVETHSWRTYPERVRSTYHLLQALFEQATRSADAWAAAAAQAARADLELAGSELPVVFETTRRERELAFRGYAYEQRASEISGGTWIVYDESRPEIWRIPLRDEVVPKVRARVPREGYYIDGGFAPEVAAVLDHHGIRYTRAPDDARLELDVFRAARVKLLPPFEGRTRTELEGTWTRETRTLDRGAIFVPIHQPLARLIVHLLDPAAPDSLAAWGVFATAFERKEYMEAYVAEQVARDMLAQDPELGAVFAAALAADPELAASPARRLDWFYRRHPSWDERLDLLPVYRR
jgi:murein tripeptide amidase MpaA